MVIKAYKICPKSPCTASTALLALIEVQGLLRHILYHDMSHYSAIRSGYADHCQKKLSGAAVVWLSGSVTFP